MIPEHRQNNFDLIRLLAAAQVVVAHAIGHTQLAAGLSGIGRHLFDAFMMLPGVPVFFVISGFLIMKSFERNPADLTGSFWRRALRIFPALWVCLAVTLLALGVFGFLQPGFVLSKTFAAWFAGQVSFLQFYNPEHFRGFGIGVANGALWTITVELQFYIFVPIYYFLTGGVRAGSMLSKTISALLLAISFGLYCIMDHKVNGPGGFTGAPLPFKLLHVTLLPHLWMFLLGVAIHRSFARLRPWIEGKFIAYALGYVAIMSLVAALVEHRSALYYFAYLPARTVLAFGTIAAAYSMRSLSQRLLGGTDISYGIYIYHSVVINVLVQLAWMNSMLSVGAVYVISIALALASWHWIEKPALACKSFSPRAVWKRMNRRAV